MYILFFFNAQLRPEHAKLKSWIIHGRVLNLIISKEKISFDKKLIATHQIHPR